MATRSLGALTLDLILQMGGFEQGMSQAERATQRTADMATAAGKRFDALVDSIDPVFAAEKRLAQQQNELTAALKAGMIDQEWYDDLTAKLHQQNTAMRGGATSVGQYRNAMRTLPAQMTDVVTQLQGGQNPFTILLQQGGQIKDQFGGVGPAISGVGRYALSLVNPFTVAAAALGTFGAAALLDVKNLGSFQQSLDLTNNYVGATTAQLQGLTQAISDQGNSYSVATDAVNQLASSGQYSFSQVSDAASAVTLANQATGESVDSLVQSYQKIGQDPVQALIDLNQQYHNIDPSQLQMVQRLQEMGDKQGAVEAAGKAWADSTKDVSQRIIDNMDPVDRALTTIAQKFSHVLHQAEQWAHRHANNGLSYALGSRPEANIDDRIYRLQQDAQSGRYSASGAESAQSNSQELQMLLAFRSATDYVTKSVQARSQAQSDLAVAVASENKQLEANQTQLEQIDRKQTQLAKDRAHAESLAHQAGRELTPDESAVFDQRQAQLNAQFNDQLNSGHQVTQRQPTQRQHTDSAADRQLATLRQQSTALRAQLEDTQKLTTQQQALVQFNQQIADLKQKRILTADQKSLLANQDTIRAQLQENSALAQQIQHRKQLQQLDSFNQQLQSGTDQLGQQYSGSISTMYMGKRQQQEFNQSIQLQNQYQQQSQRLQEQYNKGQISGDIYETESANLKNAYEERLKMTQDYYAQQQQMREDWTNGLKSAFADYTDQATDIAGQTSQLVTSVMNDMTNAIVDGITHGGISLETLGDIGQEVIDGVLKMLVQYGIQMAANAVLGETLGASATAASAAQAGVLSAAWAPAASMASLASFGANAAPAIAGITTTMATTQGLALAGMAHSGIDSVPEDGTWLLQKGERVTTADTSAKLDATLSRIDQNRQSGGGMNVVVNNNNGSRVGRQQLDMNTLAIHIDDDYENDGPFSRVMAGRTTTRRSLK